MSEELNQKILQEILKGNWYEVTEYISKPAFKLDTLVIYKDTKLKIKDILEESAKQIPEAKKAYTTLVAIENNPNK